MKTSVLLTALFKPLLLCTIVLSCIGCKEDIAVIGKQAPEIAVFDLAGTQRSLNEGKGKPFSSISGQKPVAYVLQN
ncbi:ResA [Pasteurella multocida subsp. multocida str. Anand1_buffalo]|nr:ResA [Pasteurella multocida subsp. multocida str. Anand1_buffalo]